MFGKSKFMHIEDTTDEEHEAFEAREINEVTAFCGQPIVRGWLFNRGGSRRDAPICEPCAIAAGWVWDEETADWCPPSEEDVQWDADDALSM